MYQYNLVSTSRAPWWERQRDLVKGRQDFLREIEDKEDPQDCLGGRDGAKSNMVSPEIFLEERVSELRHSGQAEIAWVVIQGLGDRAGVGHLGVGACPPMLIPQLPRLGRAHPAHRPSRLHSCGHPQGMAELAAFEHPGSY